MLVGEKEDLMASATGEQMEAKNKFVIFRGKIKN